MPGLIHNDTFQVKVSALMLFTFYNKVYCYIYKIYCHILGIITKKIKNNSHHQIMQTKTYCDFMVSNSEDTV